ncbi:hypothetical protein FIBSPDRAFT_847731 [Athelia psychrophila]|uniref:Uncharacterized protein n=1 Tax=Athelia psychrophila TaxID=1759441 RepID=A0A166VW40_9AGAM|nr:hypothetical protein FIBSPDRAFT_847731 [Fibularhizoctonia sp. CBS 109695]
MTSLEVSNLGRYGFMGGRGGATLNGQMGHQHTHFWSDADDGTALEPRSTGNSHKHGVCANCGSGFLTNMLGLAGFTMGKTTTGLAHAGKATNPFDLGIMGN